MHDDGQPTRQRHDGLFHAAVPDQFDDVPITSGTTCARAARHRVPILVPDVTTDIEWAPYLSFSEEAGFGGLLYPEQANPLA